MNDLVFVQCNVRLTNNQLFEKNPDTYLIVLEDIDHSSERVMENQPTTFKDDDLCWMDSKPLATPKVPSTSDVPRGLTPTVEAEGDHDTIDEDPNRGDEFDDLAW